MLTTTIMATKAPVVFAPAMNTNMYENVIVQENISKLKRLGFDFIEPASGRLACGDTGQGKLADTKLIAEYTVSRLNDQKDLANKKVLVTAGPTVSDIDPVRYITNRSSGKMGFAIAEEARDRGAEVVLVTGPTDLEAPFGMKVIRVRTNEEMMEAVLDDFDSSDIVIKSAAVADYKPKQYHEKKIKKTEGDLSIEFVRDNDILKTLGERKKDQVLVGFAAESNDLIDNAQGKLKRKNLDFIVANDISKSETGFASDDNIVTIISSKGEKTTLEKMSKKQVARNLFDIIEKR
jgi:phosphopantothenoylcysteine decarboxylase/phosphopantothenate--cysteine ligase